MSDRIDIHEPIFELCRRLGLQPETVAEITFRPSSVSAIVFTLDGRKGGKQINPDGSVATETHNFEVTTHVV